MGSWTYAALTAYFPALSPLSLFLSLPFSIPLNGSGFLEFAMCTRLVYIDSCYCLASVKGMYHHTRMVFQDLLCRAVGLWDLQVCKVGEG